MPGVAPTVVGCRPGGGRMAGRGMGRRAGGRWTGDPVDQERAAPEGQARVPTIGRLGATSKVSNAVPAASWRWQAKPIMAALSVHIDRGGT